MRSKSTNGLYSDCILKCKTKSANQEFLEVKFTDLGEKNTKVGSLQLKITQKKRSVENFRTYARQPELKALFSAEERTPSHLHVLFHSIIQQHRRRAKEA